MKTLNRILIQLDKAVALANSQLPQERALAVILFDNLVEFRLYKYAEFTLALDQTTWYKGNRVIDKETRENAVGPKGKYDRLLKLSSRTKIITSDEMEILNFAHEIRNAVYHRGEDDISKINLAILIYYSFISTKFKKWIGSPGFSVNRQLPGYAPIDFGQGLSKSSRHFGDGKYFETAFGTIMAKWNIASSLAEHTQSVIYKQLTEIQEAIELIDENKYAYNYYAALGRFSYLNDLFVKYQFENRYPKSLDRILLLTLYIRTHKEYLDDIPGLKIRTKEGRRLLNSFNKTYKGVYPYKTDLTKIRLRANAFKGKSNHSIVKSLIDIQNKIFNYYQDVTLAAHYLAWHMDDEAEAAMDR